MKVSVYPETSPASIQAEVNAIHLVRPVKKKKMEAILGKCGCREVSMSKSCLKRLPAKTRKAIEANGANIRVEEKRGRAIGIPLEKMMHAIELRKDYQSLREIERLTEIPKSTVHYLVKYAHRDKVKKGGKTIYLK